MQNTVDKLPSIKTKKPAREKTETYNQGEKGFEEYCCDCGHKFKNKTEKEVIVLKHGKKPFWKCTRCANNLTKNPCYSHLKHQEMNFR